MLKKILTYIKSDRNLPFVFVLFLIALFLRFYRLDAFTTFLGDQARDTIVIKRILTGQHFPAIGPVSSVGNVYLGPFYYYFIAFWLWFFNFDPIGLAIGVVFFSSLFILINYFVVDKLLDKKTALISTLFIVFSYTLVNFSRFSWNPNLLPLTSLLTVYFVIKTFKKHYLIDAILAGAFLSFCLQLHYLALVLLPPIGVFAIWEMFENKGKIKNYVKNIFAAIASFTFFSLPLFIFDIKHGFTNFKNFLMVFKNQGITNSNKFNSLIDSFFYLNKYAFNIELAPIVSILLIVGLVIAFSVLIKKRSAAVIFVLFFFLMLLGLSAYSGPKHPHYFGSLYPIYYIVIAYFLSQLSFSIFGDILIGVFVISFVVLNGSNYYSLLGRGSYQIDKAKKISRVIYNNVRGKKYSLTALPEVYSDHTARYFLEIWDKKPLERDDSTRTNELFVICEKDCGDPIGNPLYDIARFAARKIGGQWTVDDVKIYRLIH